MSPNVKAEQPGNREAQKRCGSRSARARATCCTSGLPLWLEPLLLLGALAKIEVGETLVGNSTLFSQGPEVVDCVFVKPYGELLPGLAQIRMLD